MTLFSFGKRIAAEMPGAGRPIVAAFLFLRQGWDSAHSLTIDGDGIMETIRLLDRQ
jgi:hypothetical protein